MAGVTVASGVPPSATAQAMTWSATDRYCGGLPRIRGVNGFRLHETAVVLQATPRPPHPRLLNCVQQPIMRRLGGPKGASNRLRHSMTTNERTFTGNPPYSTQSYSTRWQAPPRRGVGAANRNWAQIVSL